MTVQLTEEQKRDLDRTGYLYLPALLNNDAVSALVNRVEALLAAEGDMAGSEHYLEARARRLANLANKGDLFRPLWRHPLVLVAVQAIIGPEIRLSLLNMRDARPHIAEGQPLHVDTTPGGKPDSQGYWVATALWMLDDFTLENGATRLVPGSHRSGQLPVEAMADPLASHPEEHVMTGRRGDALVFNGHCWHGGRPNLTDRPRRAILAHYWRADHPLPADRRPQLSPQASARLTPEERTLLGIHDR